MNTGVCKQNKCMFVIYNLGGGRHNYGICRMQIHSPQHLYIAPVLQNAPAAEVAVDPDGINVIFFFSEVSKFKL